MKFHIELGGERSLRWLVCMLLAFTLGVPGCSQSNLEQQKAQQALELTRLRDENKEVQRLRGENKELPRLRKDNEELPKLRGYTEEIENLRKDNDRVRAQIAESAKARNQRQQQAAQQAAAQAAAQAQQAAALSRALGTNQGGVIATNVLDPNIPQEGDEIFIDPKFLAKLLPQFDWSKLERKEPISVKAFLEQEGVVLTNYQQLIGLGITNYVIHHAPKPVAAPVPPTR